MPRRTCAEVAELADALDSGSSARKGVGVRVPASAPSNYSKLDSAPLTRYSTIYRRRDSCALLEKTEVDLRESRRPGRLALVSGWLGGAYLTAGRLADAADIAQRAPRAGP
jgi:hypothetical protein